VQRAGADPPLLARIVTRCGKIGRCATQEGLTREPATSIGGQFCERRTLMSSPPRKRTKSPSLLFPSCFAGVPFPAPGAAMGERPARIPSPGLKDIVALQVTLHVEPARSCASLSRCCKLSGFVIRAASSGNQSTRFFTPQGGSRGRNQLQRV
jgi:hypothetical protein